MLLRISLHKNSTVEELYVVYRNVVERSVYCSGTSSKALDNDYAIHFFLSNSDIDDAVSWYKRIFSQ